MPETQLLAASEEALALAARLLASGQVVAFPSETVYGLGADARSATGVAAIFAAKGRPAHNPLIVHVVDLEAAKELVHLDARAERIAKAFWPGPLTLVLPLRSSAGLAPAVTAGLATLAVRVPAHPVARALLSTSGAPIAAPSANRSGTLSPTAGSHVARTLSGRIPLVLDGGAAQVGLESTILDLSGPQPLLLRPGAITQAALELHLGPLRRSDGSPDAPSAPGQLLKHYAPRLPLRLHAQAPRSDEAWLAFGTDAHAHHVPQLNLSPSADLVEAARNLFAMLHELDQSTASGIAVAPIPQDGVGTAIHDRLTRAAHRD